MNEARLYVLGMRKEAGTEKVTDVATAAGKQKATQAGSCTQKQQNTKMATCQLPIAGQPRMVGTKGS